LIHGPDNRSEKNDYRAEDFPGKDELSRKTTLDGCIAPVVAHDRIARFERAASVEPTPGTPSEFFFDAGLAGSVNRVGWM